MEFIYINRQGVEVKSWVIEGAQSLPEGYENKTFTFGSSEASEAGGD